MPYIKNSNPIVSSSKPGRSSGPRTRGAFTGTCENANASTAAPSGKLSAKIQRHETKCVTSPP